MSTCAALQATDFRLQVFRRRRTRCQKNRLRMGDFGFRIESQNNLGIENLRMRDSD